MNGLILTAAVVVGAYLVGSFPSAYVMTRLFGKGDIRKIGSGNLGGMNTVRNAGRVPGVLTGLFDFGKGLLVVYLVRHLTADPYLPLWAAVACVAGHNWMIYMGFRGGKGLGATIGALLLLAPLALPVALVVAVLASLALKDSYAGTVAGVASIPASLWFIYQDPVRLLFGMALAAVIIAKHVPDLKRFAAGKKELI
ncbi:MAG TPA: glycerol-3-phosphate acyltransferase [Bacillota bacterium]